MLVGLTTIDFFSDGTYTTNAVASGSYELKDGKLVMTIDGQFSFSFDYNFPDSNHLTIIDINDVSATYIKQ